MNAKYGLYIKKGNDIRNTMSVWNIGCISIPFRVGGTVKELAKRDWPDEHGEDVFIPAKLPFEAYDAEFEMAYVGKELASNPFDVSLACSQIDNFKKWLSGNDSDEGTGAELSIYSPYTTMGRKCYLKEISGEEPHVQLKQENGNLYNENIVTFKVTFRVIDPMTNVSLTSSSS